MARYIVMTPVTLPGSGYGQPARTLLKQHVVELSAAEVTAIGAGNLRAVVYRDTLGEAVGVSNSS